MTINAYLGQLKRLKIRADNLSEKVTIAEDRATRLRDSLNIGDGIRTRSRSGKYENVLLELADAAKQWKAARQEYIDFRTQLENNIYNLLYWEGLLISQVYIYNVITDSADDLNGVDEILKTNNRRRILAKLNEAEEHLRRILIDQGIEIE